MIDLDVASHVATAVLNHPPVNAINRNLVDELDRVLAKVEASEEVSVLHIRSSTRAFCAGADLALMRALLARPGGGEEMVELIREFQRVLVRLEASGVITVAEIGGAALGGGLELALACDLRVAAGSAKLGLPEAGLGLVPGAGGTQRLPRLCGDAVARRIILGAEVVDGHEAARIGLAQWVLPDPDLASWTHALVERLGALPRQGVAACKRCLAASRDTAVDGFELELLETRRLYGNVDTQQRIRAFVERK